jgi:hypothetical protein
VLWNTAGGQNYENTRKTFRAKKEGLPDRVLARGFCFLGRVFAFSAGCAAIYDHL